jgi:hypothetical protein
LGLPDLAASDCPPRVQHGLDRRREDDTGGASTRGADNRLSAPSVQLLGYKCAAAFQRGAAPMPDSSQRVVIPRYVALDSSHLGAVAADVAAKDQSCRRRAEVFAHALEASGGILLLCWHHLQELFSHRNEDVVAQRVAYLQSLPMVAAVASFRQDDTIGTVLDLQCFEIATAFKNPDADAVLVRDEAANRVFRLASGAELIQPFL